MFLYQNKSWTDFDVTVSLFTQQWWEIVKMYCINVSHSEFTDKLEARNIKVSFINNELVPIDIMELTIYANTFIIDKISEIITK